MRRLLPRRRIHETRLPPAILLSDSIFLKISSRTCNLLQIRARVLRPRVGFPRVVVAVLATSNAGGLVVAKAAAPHPHRDDDDDRDQNQGCGHAPQNAHDGLQTG